MRSRDQEVTLVYAAAPGAFGEVLSWVSTERTRDRSLVDFCALGFRSTRL